MSKIITRSKFYYGTNVTLLNGAIDFSEDGVTQLNATLFVNDYTVTGYAEEIQRAMRVAGTQDYVVTFNRVTRKLTISAPNPFELWTDSGSRQGTSAWSTMGFSTTADFTGANTYTSDGNTGKVYTTQYPVDNYLDPADNTTKESATYNVTTSGVAQIITFGDTQRISMNIRVITNITDVSNKNFLPNATGISDFYDFRDYILVKAKVEFMKDEANLNDFHACFLESTREDRTGFRLDLKNMGTPDFYETGVITFRKVS